MATKLQGTPTLTSNVPTTITWNISKKRPIALRVTGMDVNTSRLRTEILRKLSAKGYKTTEDEMRADVFITVTVVPNGTRLLPTNKLERLYGLTLGAGIGSILGWLLFATTPAIVAGGILGPGIAFALDSLIEERIVTRDVDMCIYVKGHDAAQAYDPLAIPSYSNPSVEALGMIYNTRPSTCLPRQGYIVRHLRFSTQLHDLSTNAVNISSELTPYLMNLLPSLMSAG